MLDNLPLQYYTFFPPKIKRAAYGVSKKELKKHKKTNTTEGENVLRYNGGKNSLINPLKRQKHKDKKKKQKHGCLIKALRHDGEGGFPATVRE